VHRSVRIPRHRRLCSSRKQCARVFLASAGVRCPCAALARRHRDPSRPLRPTNRRGQPPQGWCSPSRAACPPRRPLSAWPRQALSARRQTHASAEACHDGSGDLPRHRHDVLAGADGGGDASAAVVVPPRASLTDRPIGVTLQCGNSDALGPVRAVVRRGRKCQVTPQRPPKADEIAAAMRRRSRRCWRLWKVTACGRPI